MSETMYEPAQMAPNSQDAEESTLGSILINPAVLLIIMMFLKAEHFFILRNAWVYEAMLRLHARGEVIDYITLVEELRSQDRLDDIGGAAYITYLTSNVGTSMHAETYAAIVYRAGIRRELLEASTEIARLARVEDKTIDMVIDLAEAELSNVTGAFRKAKHSGLKPVYDVVELAVEQYQFGEPMTEEQHEDAALISAFDDYQESLKNVLKPGYIDMDKFLRFMPGLYHVCARPRVGKSMFMQNVIYNMLMNPFIHATPMDGRIDGLKLIDRDCWLYLPTMSEVEHLPTLAMFSAEMTTEQIMMRWIAMITGVSTSQQLYGEMSFEEFRNVQTAKKLLKSLETRLLITSGTITPALVRSEVRLWRPDMAFTDYTQKMHPGGGRYNTRADEISFISGELQNIAITEKIPVMSGAQINRDGSSAPSLETIKASGAIEEDSDVVLLLHRPELYEENTKHPNMLMVDVAKNRNGECRVVELMIRKSLMRLANAIKIDLSNMELV